MEQLTKRRLTQRDIDRMSATLGYQLKPDLADGTGTGFVISRRRIGHRNGLHRILVVEIDYEGGLNAREHYSATIPDEFTVNDFREINGL